MVQSRPASVFGRFLVLKGAVRELWIIFGAKLLAILAYGIMNSTLVLWLSSDLGYSDTRAGLIVAAWSAAMTLFTVLVGSLVDAIGLRKAFLLGFGVEHQEVAGRSGGRKLLHRKLQTRLGFGIGLRGIDQGHQGAGVEQIHRSGEGRHGVVRPRFIGKTAVFEFGVFLQALVPQLGGLRDVVFLQSFEFVGRKRQGRRGTL